MSMKLCLHKNQHLHIFPEIVSSCFCLFCLNKMMHHWISYFFKHDIWDVIGTLYQYYTQYNFNNDILIDLCYCFHTLFPVRVHLCCQELGTLTVLKILEKTCFVAPVTLSSALSSLTSCSFWCPYFPWSFLDLTGLG